MHLTKEEQIIYNHFKDMYQLSYQRGIPVFSDFVDLNGLSMAYQLLDDMHVPKDIQSNRLMTYGGYSSAERQILCFVPEQSYTDIIVDDFPIACVKISPVNKKFCDKLNHRDYLGTVMNLGLERNQIGDIVVSSEGSERNDACVGYIYCQKNKAELLADINRIKHTTVVSEIVYDIDVSNEQKYKEISGSVSSLRLDAIIATAIKTSRSQCLTVIREGNVYLNGRNCTENAKQINDGDIISIRGYGKFLVEESQTLTKKGRYHIMIKQYI